MTEQSFGPTDSSTSRTTSIGPHQFEFTGTVHEHMRHVFEEMFPEHDDTKQLALFEPPSGDEAHEEDTVIQAEPDPSSRNSCCFCGRRVLLEDPSTHEEITSWVHGKKKDSAVLRTRSGRLACGDCIAKMRAGMAVDQQDYETLLDSNPARSDVDDIFSDRSPDYTLGYRRGLAGSALHPTGPIHGDAGGLDYLEGYSDGEEARLAKERLGTPLSQKNEMPEV